MNKRLTKISKYLTFVLRHEPQSIGITPDGDGYFNIDELVRHANTAGKSITVEQVREVLARQELPLFAQSDDGQMIRAV